MLNLWSRFRQIVLAATALWLVWACAHIPPAITDFGQCVNQALSPKIEAIITQVETALAADDWKALLTNLVGQVGGTVVDCAVHEVLGTAQAKHAGAPSDVISGVKIVHAQAWLAR